MEISKLNKTKMVGTNTNIMNIMHEEHPPVY